MDGMAAGQRTWSGAEAALRPVLGSGRDGAATSPTLRRRAKEDDASLRELPPLLRPDLDRSGAKQCGERPHRRRSRRRWSRSHYGHRQWIRVGTGQDGLGRG